MKGKIKSYIRLHIILFMYSFIGIFSKLAAKENLMSLRFCLIYGCMIILLGIYAVVWQQIIKKMPLSVAFSNKAVTVIWSYMWSVVLFDDIVTVRKIIGMALVIWGIVLFAISDRGGSRNGFSI